MNINARIEMSGDAKELDKLFACQSKGSKNNRALYTAKIVKNAFVIDIRAKDSTAFRAVANSVSKLLSVYEKTKAMIKNGN